MIAMVKGYRVIVRKDGQDMELTVSELSELSDLSYMVEGMVDLEAECGQADVEGLYSGDEEGPEEPEEDVWIGVREASDMLDVSDTQVRAWFRDGSIPASKVGGAWRTREQDVRAFMASREDSE